jgi:hypothetical protein
MNIHGSLFSMVCVLFLHTASAQVDSLAILYSKVITVDELSADLHLLANDSLEGRDTGKDGQRKAARYIRERFMAFGIPPVPVDVGVMDGYYQPFELLEERSGSISITNGDRTLSFLKELLYFNEGMTSDRTLRELVYMGDGAALTNAKGMKGKVALIQEPGTGSTLMMLAGLKTKATAATNAEVEILLVATSRMSELVEQMGHYVSGSRMRLLADVPRGPKAQGVQVIFVDAAALDPLLGRNTLATLGKRKPGRKVPVNMTVKHQPLGGRVTSENVLGYIEGGDKKEELIVISAHYDHIGVEHGEVYNGADDDGSGTVALLAIAKAFAEAKANGHGPRRSVLVMPVSGEEKGLLGSKHYSEFPVFPLEKTVANLNIDMIGRVDSAHAGKAPYVYVIGSDRLSTELHEINEAANRTYTRMELDYTFNAPNDPNRFYYRSDHYNFARKGVPAIFFFSGVHEDYHKPTDTVDKILFDLVHQRTLLVFHTAWELANREDRIVVDGKVE